MYRYEATITILFPYAFGLDLCYRLLAGFCHDTDLLFHLFLILTSHRRTRSNCRCSLVELRSMYGHTMPTSTPGNNRRLADRENPGSGEWKGNCIFRKILKQVGAAVKNCYLTKFYPTDLSRRTIPCPTLYVQECKYNVINLYYCLAICTQEDK